METICFTKPLKAENEEKYDELFRHLQIVHTISENPSVS